VELESIQFLGGNPSVREKCGDGSTRTHELTVPVAIRGPRNTVGEDGVMPARRLAGLASVVGAATALSLVFPWVRVGGRSRSSIDLIGSAGTLEIIEGGVRFAVVAAWFLIPTLVAFAMLAGAADRLRVCAGLLLPLGPALMGVLAVAALTAGRQLVWGAYVTAAGAFVTSGIALLLLRRLRHEEVSR